MLTLPKPFTYATAAHCANCKIAYPLHSINTYATCCSQPLIIEYDHSLSFLKASLQLRKNNMWRYAEMLPVINEDNVVTLGEGMTPLFALNKLADK